MAYIEDIALPRCGRVKTTWVAFCGGILSFCVTMMSRSNNRRNKNVPVVSPIPSVVEVSDDENVNNSLLRYGTATPAKMATTAGNIVSPLAVFHENEKYFKDQDYFIDNDDNESSLADHRLGIRRPVYRRGDDASKISGTSHRIGITRPLYDIPDGEIPISPLNLYLEKKATSPTPNLVELSSEDSPNSFLIAFHMESPIMREDPSSPDSDDDKNDDDSIDRMVHERTAEGHYLVNSAPLTTPRDVIKFSLTKGTDGMSKAMIRASEKHVTRPPRPPVLRSASFPGSLGPPDVSFKVFLLLLNPRAKIFELIQVIYSPSITTIGDIVEMIPVNATEPALGSQSYIGLCRPKDGMEMNDMRLMASGSHNKMSCARIIRGEILVAIPSGYSGEHCAELAGPILTNKRIVKLLQRSDPLAASRKHKTKRRRSSGHKSSSCRSSSSRVDTVKEETESEQSSPCQLHPTSDSKEVKQAMKNALEAAAMANAELPDRSQQLQTTVMLKKRDSSLASLDQWRTTTDLDATTASGADNASIDSTSCSVASISSYHSGLKSKFSFESTSRKLHRRLATRRKHLHSKRSAYVGRVVAVVSVFLVARFMTDANAPHDREDASEIFGCLGLMQFLVVFGTLCKIQKYVGRKRQAELKCPFVRVSIAVATLVQERMAMTSTSPRRYRKKRA